MSATFTIHSEAEMLEWGQKLGKQLIAGDIVALNGNLGAGKTTLARGILAGCGFLGEVPSPSFAIVQNYDPPDCRIPVAHIDLYRIEDPADLAELGIEDMMETGALLIEWPDRWLDLSNPQLLRIAIEDMDGNHRQLTVSLGDAWEGRWQ
jgi:tRNA threonylcarbamoyladenosine biosynthesis protein TsaE